MKTLLISDVHGNLEALEKVLSLEKWNEIFCMGDLVDYGPSPEECVNLLKRKADIVVRGNHDNAVASGMDCGCSYEIKALSQEVRKYTTKVMSTENVEYLGSLPIMVSTENTFVIHASRDDLFGYLRPNTSVEEFDVFDDLEESVVFMGHTHIPMDRHVKSRRYINPGSLGQPRDGDPRGSYAFFEDGKLYFDRVEYDMERTVEKMKDAGLPSRAVRILRQGKVVP